MSAPVRPDPREQKGDLGALRRDPDVARRRDHGAGARHRAVERRHDRTAALADREDEIAGEAGELEQPGGVPGEQRADDVLDVSAGAEGPAGAGDDDGADAGLGVQGAEGIPQLGVDLEGERVEPLGPVERDGRDRGRRVDGVEERLGLRAIDVLALEWGHPSDCCCRLIPRHGLLSPAPPSPRSPPPPARSTSDVTSTSAIAGKWLPIRRRYTSPSGLRLARYCAMSVT